MEYLSVLISVALIWGAAALIPGPDFMMIVQATTSNSRLHGIAVVLGIATGTIIWGVAGFFGISALFALVPWLYVALKMLGGAYLVYLGIRLIKQSLKPQSKLVPMHFGVSESLAKMWLRGLLTNLLNPKTAVFVASIYATTLPTEPSVTLGVMVVALTTGISLIWYLTVAHFFASATVIRTYKRGAKLVDRATGGLFILFGSKLALDQ